MYPKSIFSVITREREADEAFCYKGDSPKDSQLLLSNNENSVYDKIDIAMPYLLVRETLDRENDVFIYEEFSEKKHISIKSTYSKINKKIRKQHSHNFYELFFVCSGKLTLHIEDEYVDYYAGDCCICNKTINHVACYDNDFDAVILCLKEDFISQVARTNIYYNNKGETRSFPAIFDLFINQNQTNTSYVSKIVCELKNICKSETNPSFECIYELIREITHTNSGKSFFIRGLLCRFLDILQNEKYYEETIYHAKLTKEDEIINKLANSYIDKRKILTRAEIEEITGYNGDYVERIVKKGTGKTLKEFGRDYILEQAIKLLDNTSMRIGEICTELGYTNRYYFNQLFTSKYGISPSEYKRKHK